jgi:hypothetical protein
MFVDLNKKAVTMTPSFVISPSEFPEFYHRNDGLTDLLSCS